MAVSEEVKSVMEKIGEKWLVDIKNLFSTLIDKQCEISAPSFQTMSLEDFNSMVSGAPWVIVDFNVETFAEGFLLMQKRDAAVIVDLIIGGDGRVPSLEFSDLHLSILEESVSQIVRSFTSALNSELKKTLATNIKQTLVNDFSPITFPQIAQIKYHNKVEDLIEGEFSFIFNTEALDAYFSKGAQAEPVQKPPSASPAEEPEEKKPFELTLEEPGESIVKEISKEPSDKPSSRRAAPPAARRYVDEGEDDEVEPPRKRRPKPSRAPSFADDDEETDDTDDGYPAHRLSLPSLKSRPVSSKIGSLEYFMDINIKVTAVLGKIDMLIRDLIGMGVGTVVQLDKYESEPVDLLVNNKLVARGEIVVVDEKFGIKITETISDMDRVLRA